MTPPGISIVPKEYAPSKNGTKCYKHTVYHNHDAPEGEVVFVSNCLLLPGGELHEHVHLDMDESFIFQSETIHFKAGTLHGLSNDDTEMWKFVCVGIRRAVG